MSQPLQKNQLLPLTVERFGMDAEGVCRTGAQGFCVFVPGALPSERILARIVKVEKRHAFARIEEIIESSPDRREPPCPVYKRCGGCVAQHMAYEATLAFKRAQVQDCLSRIGGLDIAVPEVLGMADPWRYRNKGAYPVAGQADAPRIGFYAPRTHEVIDAPGGCLIQRAEADAAVAVVRRWITEHRVAPYDELTHSGIVRHILVRSTQAGQVMLVLVTRTADLPRQAELVAALRREVPAIASIQQNINDQRGNVILGKRMITLWGADTLEETLHGLTFRVSAQSFFQVNPVQTEALYALALDYAQLTGSETVIDAYCGAGTISLLLARHARKVIGIEVVPEAIADARHNARANGIGNAEFLCAEAERALPELVLQGLAPDVVVVDPPRKGCDPALLDAVLAAKPARVVYVSCNPATLARDAAHLAAGGYTATKVQPVDMFCWAGGIETVLLMERGG